MAAVDNVAVTALLNYEVLTAPVNRIITELPRILPAALYDRTRNTYGNKFRRVVFRGTRQVSRINPYGAPPREVRQVGAGIEDVIMLHTIERITAGPEIMQLFHGYTNYGQQINLAEQELDRRAVEFGKRVMNLRTTAIHCAIAFGKLWFDSDGNIQTSSSGADLEVDYRIPSGNIAASTVDWSSASSDIPTYVLGLNMSAVQATGRPLAYAIMGKNVPGYLAKNTSFQQYLARNPQYNQYYVNTGTVAPGTLNLTWVNAQNVYFENSSGVITEIFPADQITFLPEITSDFYELKVGSYPVPKSFGWLGQNGDFNEAIRNILSNPVYGAFRYAYGQPFPVPEVVMVQGDTFIPDIMVPEAMFIIDTTP